MIFILVLFAFWRQVKWLRKQSFKSIIDEDTMPCRKIRIRVTQYDMWFKRGGVRVRVPGQDWGLMRRSRGGAAAHETMLAVYHLSWGHCTCSWCVCDPLKSSQRLTSRPPCLFSCALWYLLYLEASVCTAIILCGLVIKCLLARRPNVK